MIEINNISKSFDGAAVLKDFSLSLKKGERVCLMGRSGCGKTTLLRLLLGLEEADSGSILAGGKISCVFQEDRLCEDFSALSNVTLTGCDKEKAASVLCALGLCDELLRPVREFSGGMKRRVAIARALCAEYDILLLDEAFSGLDNDTRGKVAEFICSFAADKTILMVSHDIEDAELLSAKIIKL